MTAQSDQGSFPQAEIPTVGPLDDLIARLEAGDDADDRDERLARWLYENPGICGGLVNYDPMLWLERNGGWTTSLDAALALAERVLPEHGPIDLTIMGSAKVTIWSNDPCGRDLSDAFGHTPALALCIAVLKAVSVGTERSEVSSNTPTTHKGEDQ